MKAKYRIYFPCISHSTLHIDTVFYYPLNEVAKEACRRATTLKEAYSTDMYNYERKLMYIKE